MSLSTTLSTQSQGSASTSGPSSTSSSGKNHPQQQKQQDQGDRGSSAMITLATASDVVVVGCAATAASTEPVSTASTVKLATSAEASSYMMPTTTTAPRTAAAASNPTSGIVAAASVRTRNASATTTGTAMTTRAATIRRRHKVKEFNDEISCSLCSGYLVNATCIDYCGHSYCRSCIVRHLKGSKHCPQCSPASKQISLSNLVIDERLKSLVYKLVPGLYHNEHQRQLQFGGTETIDDPVIAETEEDYFSPVEPISLSLEYHPDALVGCDKEKIPPVRYLQCPAAVTVHHLKRFISSKYDIDLANGRVGIEMLYEGEILPEDFSLMDVGYCYSWKRDAPMKFSYRILIHSGCNNTNKVITSDNILSKTEDIVEAKCTKQTSEEATQSERVVPAPNYPLVLIEKVLPPEVIKGDEDDDGGQDEDDDEDDDDDNDTVIDDTYKNSRTTYTILKTRSVKGDQSDSLSGCNNNNNNSPSSKDRKSDKNQKDRKSVKMTIIARKTNDVKVKPSKTKSKRSSSSPKPEVSPSSDFKSLRSNDVRYMNDYSVTLSSTSVKQHKSKTNSAKEPKCDIFVSIPQSGHRSSNSSDDSFENLSLAQLKTANKKSNTTSALKHSISLDETILSKTKATRLDVPKLKITMPKKSPSPKTRKYSVDEPTSNQVDITTYAKHIGLKPINTPTEEKKEIKLKLSPINSPSSSLSSSSASSPPSAADSGFVFNPEVTTSSHKKRKKAKHSKEPKEPGSKRRKLHAEISSHPAEESLKLKVKITGNPKSYKAERKASSSSDEVLIVTTPVASSTTPATPATVPIATPSKEKHSRVKPMVNIPNLNKTLSEASTNISHLMKDTSEATNSQEAKKPKVAKQATPVTTISTLKPLSIASSIMTSSISSALPAKLLSPKLPSLQDTKLPASPPLPPSLFKPTPMTLQPVSTVIPRAPIPVQGNPRLGLQTDIGLVGMSHLNRLIPPPKPQNNFAIPNPPRNLPKSPKLTPISSIASAANRQVQLKRSASLDGSPPTLAKQQKIEQDRLIRKSAYAPFPVQIKPNPISAAATATGNGVKAQRSPPPISVTTTSTLKMPEQTYYTSSMANTYTREIQTKKPKPISLPPSSISVTKMPDIQPGKIVQSTSGLTITPQQLSSPIQQLSQQQKPALEIVRISSNIPPIDHQKLTVTNNNTLKPSPQKTTRPLPPTIPLVKIKRTTSQVTTLKATVTTVNAPIQHQAVLSSNNKTSDSTTPVNGVNNKTDQKATTDLAKKEATAPQVKTVCDNTGALDLSGKSSRSPSQDANSPPQTPKSSSSNQPLDPQSLTAANLEAALNKLKQQMAKPHTPLNSTVAVTSVVSPISTSNMITKKPTDLLLKDTSSLNSSIATSSSLSNSNLQNLKMLSESATSREKIAIKNQRPTPMLPKLNEINKTRQTPTVRQQNASVRNIPNPSALAFRSQQPIPMLASITKTPAVTPKPAVPISSSAVTVSTSNVKQSEKSQDTIPKLHPTTTTTAAATATKSLSTLTTTKIDSSANPPAKAPSATTTATADVSKIIASKKNLHLEQLAASLNMRAAAAAGDSSIAIKVTNISSTPGTSTSSTVASMTTSHPTVTSYVPVVATSNISAINATTT